MRAWRASESHVKNARQNRRCDFGLILTWNHVLILPRRRRSPVACFYRAGSGTVGRASWSSSSWWRDRATHNENTIRNTSISVRCRRASCSVPMFHTGRRRSPLSLGETCSPSETTRSRRPTGRCGRHQTRPGTAAWWRHGGLQHCCKLSTDWTTKTRPSLGKRSSWLTQTIAHPVWSSASQVDWQINYSHHGRGRKFANIMD